MLIDQKLLDDLSAQAKDNPRLRQNYDLRTSPEDSSQRMLNALEPGTIMPIHRHKGTTETVVVIRGCFVERFYDEQGNLVEEVLLRADSDVCMVNVEKGRWHSLECLESDTVIFSSKDGAFEPLSDDDVMHNL